MEGGRRISAIAAENDRDLFRASGAECERRTGGNHRGWADDSVTAHVADRLVSDVHLARVPAVETGRLEIVFGGEFPHIDAFRDRMSARTMSAVDDVDLVERPFVVERGADARSDCFLAGVEMYQIAEAAVVQVLVGQSAFEPSDTQDCRIHVDQFFGRQIFRPIPDFAVGPGDLAAQRHSSTCCGRSLQKSAARRRCGRRGVSNPASQLIMIRHCKSPSVSFPELASFQAPKLSDGYCTKGHPNPDLMLTLNAGSSTVKICLVERSATAPSPCGVRVGRQAAFTATLISGKSQVGNEMVSQLRTGAAISLGITRRRLSYAASPRINYQGSFNRPSRLG